MNISIIGGSDGPTTIYVASGIDWIAVAAIVLAVGVAAAISVRAIIRHRRPK